ncbi:fibronectin type III domain-containing protein [Paenibacillus silvae]|uniref:fibronectin type III domain-containing protein n=1 Tax=Paenibacillus silvae TaxID=1325358 RepID=UPI00200357C6|nr:fibronectin type III domain-containing protein [Paenibacillus silvae]MCK6075253.1 fibronectin type III domain-containing protein [Paenibacillus silvae]MCK6149640.1 fibronectin type III domain-containing protein [Paenibacillus silvae]MCK6267938.1 fibronectin type III domain-containing protein [Paenibacillus silvae]
MKKLASGLVAGALLLTLTAGAVSADSSVHNLPSVPPVSDANVIVPFGSDKPSSSASTHDISVSSYNYQVQKVGAQVYTDKWLTGSTTMKVSVLDWTLVNDGGGSTNKLLISVYSANGLVANKEINPNNTFSASFTGLNKSTKYYVKFSVTTGNENTYSFNGAISAK